MHQRGFRGWIASLTVAGIFSLVFLAIEKHQLKQSRLTEKSATAPSDFSGEQKSRIILNTDPGLARVQDFPSPASAPIDRSVKYQTGSISKTENTNTAELLNRPPEPTANVVLFLPQATSGLEVQPSPQESSQPVISNSQLNHKELLTLDSKAAWDSPAALDESAESPLSTSPKLPSPENSELSLAPLPTKPSVEIEEFSNTSNLPANELVMKPIEAKEQPAIEKLMESMDEALESPIQITSSAKRTLPSLLGNSIDAEPNRVAFRDDKELTPPPVARASKMPEPAMLLQALGELQMKTDPRLRASVPRYVNRRPIPSINVQPNAQPNASEIASQWIIEVQAVLNDLIFEHGLENSQSENDLDRLAKLSSQVTQFSSKLTDHELARQLNSTAYSLQRRLEVWSAIQSGLDNTSIALSSPRMLESSRESLLATVLQVESYLQDKQNGDHWQEFLLLDKLKTWASSPEVKWVPGEKIPAEVLGRLRWPKFQPAHQRFLSQPIFDELAAHLVVWGRDPQDYRQLLKDVEGLEADSISRVRAPIAASIQVLRLSDQKQQNSVAAVLEKHYRNANLRLSVTGELLERFLPDAEYEIRPVRQRILGADTKGDLAMKTDLSLLLIPDQAAWNVGIGVASEMLSLTRSTKGPAVFHNTSRAQTQTSRFLHVDPEGYQVTAQPTSVNSRDYLRKMSTDYDGLPVLGDFVRLLVREQFDQKRSLSQRITQRIIARETDDEVDRRLRESLQTAEKGLEDRIVGPLNKLNLNPTVVSMRTDEKRLSIRYRVANESQLGAFTSRPRAPTNSLLSMQMHESSINNAIERIGFSGRTWTLPELYQRLQQVFGGANWKLPEDLPTDIQVRFAAKRPATVKLEDGKLHLTLRIAEWNQPSKNLKIERFYVTSSYIPVANGLHAELVRDGVVQITTSGPRMERVPLRIIFAKVFLARPEIPLISPALATDSRSEGLAVSQLEIRDGWLAAAISHADSEQAAEVAARANEILSR